MKKLVQLWIPIIGIILFVPLSFIIAGNNHFRVSPEKKERLDTQPKTNGNAQSKRTQFSPYSHSPTDLHWALVDSMPNAYGVASTNINPFAYDPWSNALAIIFRGHPSIASGGGTGSMWYAYSLDDASTWTRTPAQLNADIPAWGRYPSCSISNPTHSPDDTTTVFEYSYPQLDPSQFGSICYGFDPFSAGTPNTTEYQNKVGNPYGSHTYMTVSDDGQPNVYFLIEQTDLSRTRKTDLTFWRTTDQGETWNEKTDWAVPGHWGSLISERIHCFGNTIYVEAVGTAIGTTEPALFFETTSTDNGETWSNWLPIDWRTIPQFSTFDDFGTLDGTIAHDFVVDADGNEHYFFTLVDTDQVDNAQKLKIVETYNSPDGWKGHIVASRTSTLIPGFGNLKQMDNELEATITEDRTAIALKWVDAPQEGETAGNIFVCVRTINNVFPYILNITEPNSGPQQRQMFTHLAPRMKNLKEGGLATLFIMKTTQLENIPDDSLIAENPCAIWAATAHVWAVVLDITERETGIPQTFKLYSNYPNPFNPTTTINYDIPTATNVMLKIFDVAGKEVATLFNGYQQAGKYQATFDASRFASGVYLYTLQAGEFSTSRKMLLQK